MSNAPEWAIRSVLVSVRDLDRSSTFYQDVMNVPEVLREGQIALLGGEAAGSFMLMLREDSAGTRHGQQALGVRTLAYDVGSTAELERVESRLRALGAFRDRIYRGEIGIFDSVRGHDPDRLPLTFVANELELGDSLDLYRRAVARMYAVDM